MANFTPVNTDDDRQTKEGAARHPESEPQRSVSATPLETIHEHVPLGQDHLDPAVTAAGVTVIPDTIHESQVKGTVAEAHPGNSPFKTPQPLHDEHADHPHRGIVLKIKNALSWLKLHTRARARRQKRQAELGLAA